MLKLSNAVYDVQSSTPEYAVFEKQKKNWNITLQRLGRQMQEQYDNLVIPAFLDYQETLENYLIARGILQTIGRRPGRGKSRGVHVERMEVPGLGEAAERLAGACRTFTGQLEEEDAGLCAAYLERRKEIIDAVRGLCWQCGVEFAEGLLARTEE